MASPIQRELADLHDQSPVRTSSFPALEADDMAASLAEMLEALRREQDATEAEANRVTEELAEQKALNRAQAERIAALEAELGGAASAGGDPAAARLVDAELAAIALKCEELNELNQRLVAEHNAQVEALQGEVAALRSAAADPVAAPRQPAATAPTPAPEPAPAPSRPPAEGAALPAASASPYTSEFAYSPGPELYVPPTAEGAENVLAMVAAQGERLAKAADDSLRTMRERLATAEHNCKTAELELQYALEQSAKAEQAAEQQKALAAASAREAEQHALLNSELRQQVGQLQKQLATLAESQPPAAPEDPERERDEYWLEEARMKEQLRLLTAQLAEQEEDEAGAEDGGGVGPAAADGDGSSSPAYSDDADFDDGSDDLELPDDSGARMPAAEPAAAEDGTAGDGTAEQLAQAVALAEEHGRRLAAAVAEQQRLGDEHARCTALLEGEQRAKAELSAALETQQKHADEMEVALGDLQRQVAGEKAAVDESGEGLAEQAALAEVLSEKLATAVADHAQLSAVAKQLERNLAEETRRATAAETSVGTERRRADLLEDQLRVESASMRMTEGQQSRQLAATEKRAEDALERVRALQDEKRALEAKVTAAEAAAERQPVPMRAAASSRSGSPSEASFYSAEQEPEQGVDEDIVEEVESEGHVAQGAEGPAYMAHEAHVRAADAAGQQAAAVPRPQPAASEQDVATLRGELRVLRGELTDTGAELEAQQAKSERQLRLQLEEAGRAQEVAANAAAQSLREERAAGAELTVALDKAYRQVAELEAAAKAASAEPEGSAEARLASVQHEAAAAAAQAAEAQQRLTSELESTRAAHDEALERAVANEKRIAENAQHIAALEAAATTAAAAARQAPPESAAPVGSVDALAQLQVKLDAANAELAERQRRLVASEASEAQAAAALRHREEQLAERERTMPRQQIAAPDLGVAAAGEQAASAEQTQALAARVSELESQLAASDAMYEELQTESIGKEEEIGVMGRKLRELRAKVRAAPASPPRPSEADQAAQEEERRREAAQQAEVVEALQLASAELLEAQKELQVLRVAQQEHEDKEKAWEREKKSRRQRGEGGGDAAEVERLKGCVDELVAQLGLLEEASRKARATDRETIEELEARLETLAAARNAAQAAASPGRHAEYDLRNSWAGGESRQTPGVRFEPPSAMPSEWRAAPSPAGYNTPERRTAWETRTTPPPGATPQGEGEWGWSPPAGHTRVPRSAGPASRSQSWQDAFKGFHASATRW